MTGQRAKHGPGPADVPLPMKIPRNSGPSSARDAENTKADTVFAYGNCPGHRDDKRTGLLLQSSHLVWRNHDVMVGLPGKEKRIPCRTSGVALCNDGALPLGGVITLNQNPKQRESDPMHGVRKARCLHKSE